MTDEEQADLKVVLGTDYPLPVVDHNEARKEPSICIVKSNHKSCHGLLSSIFCKTAKTILLRSAFAGFYETGAPSFAFQ